MQNFSQLSVYFWKLLGKRKLRHLIKYWWNWLQDIFSDDSEVEDGRVQVKDVQPDTLQTLIRFCYTDQVKDDELTTELLGAARKYKIKGVNFTNHFESILLVDLISDFLFPILITDCFKNMSKSKKG